MISRRVKGLFFSGCMLLAAFSFFKTKTKVETIAGYKKADIQEVLTLTDVKWDGKDIQQLVELTQKAWLRPAGKELYDLGPTYEEKRSDFITLFTKMGLINAWPPSGQQYDYIFFTGATTACMEGRMESLAKLLTHGLTYTKIVFLSGFRVTTAFEKEHCKNKGWDLIPEVEADAYPYLFLKYGIPLEKIVAICAAETVKPDGTMYRPTMTDAVMKWLMKNPTPGKVLVISNQPFCHYQKTVIESLLPKGFEVDVMGACDLIKDRSVGVYLDTLARTIYQWSTTQNPIKQ